MSNTNSIWFAVDEDGSEWAFDLYHPLRDIQNIWYATETGNFISLPQGSIKAITGRTITWADEPIEWKPGDKTDNRLPITCAEMLKHVLDHPATHISETSRDSIHTVIAFLKLNK